MPPPVAYRLDLAAVGRGLGVDLEAALAELGTLYRDLDARLAERSAGLNLPCRRGCDMCCHQSVFLTPLEFLYAWRHLQATAADAVLAEVVASGLALWRRHRETIEALDHGADGDGEPMRPEVANLNYRCPLLAPDGACRVHPAREAAARLFGCSFLAPGSLYACHLVGAHLAGREATLPLARRELRRLQALPLTHYRQVYPYFIGIFFADS